MNTLFIGIAGGTGSGKTTLTEHLAKSVSARISASSTTTTTISARTARSRSAACRITTTPTRSTRI